MGHDDYVLVEDDEFGNEETPRMRKGPEENGGWAAAVQELYFEEEREREREREFLESLRCVPPPSFFPSYPLVADRCL